MATQNKQLRRHMKVGRRLYIKILKGLRNKGYIYKFVPHYSLSPNVSSFNIYINEKQYFTLNLHKSLLSSGVYKSMDRSWYLTASIGSTTEPRVIREFLRKNISDRLFGRATERHFSENVEKIIKSGGSHIMDVKNSTTEEDINEGIDKWIYFKPNHGSKKEIWYPLQIKTSHAKFYEHRKKFPNIPAILYIPKYAKDWKKLEKILKKIGESFIRGKALHLELPKL